MTHDRQLLRRKALIAAGSVVLALGLTACERTDDKYDDDDEEVSWFDGEDADDSGFVDGEDDSGDCYGEGLAPDCLEVEGGEDWAACCDDLAQWCADEFGAETQEAQDCTWGPDYDGSTGCIPWGPPVPPAFRGARAAVA